VGLALPVRGQQPPAGKPAAPAQPPKALPDNFELFLQGIKKPSAGTPAVPLAPAKPPVAVTPPCVH
jgi:hypothetical protein